MKPSHIMAVAVAVLVGVPALGVGMAYLGLGVGWAVKPAELLNADRVQRVRTDFIDRSHQLTALRQQRVTARGVVETIRDRAGSGRWSVQDRADYDSAIRTAQDVDMAYSRACAQYNADWDNTYKTITTRGLDIPTRCEP